jgi:hypothetical protein
MYFCGLLETSRRKNNVSLYIMERQQIVAGTTYCWEFPIVLCDILWNNDGRLLDFLFGPAVSGCTKPFLGCMSCRRHGMQ